MAEWTQFAILCGQLFVTVAATLAFFRLRRHFGLVPLAVFVGSNQYLQTLLSSTHYLQFGEDFLVSPGSVVLFPAGLVALLLIYHHDGVEKARGLIIGVLLANLSLTVFSWFTQAQIRLGGVANLLGVPPELFEVDARVFLAGSSALAADAVLIVVLYEVVTTRWKSFPVALRMPAALSLVLLFDAVVFSSLAFLGKPEFGQILLTQVLSKLISAGVYGLLLVTYLRWSSSAPGDLGQGVGTGAFAILTYRERFELLRSHQQAQEQAFERERAQSRAALDAAEARYRWLFRTMTDGLLVLDDRDRIVDLNPAFVALCGRSAEDLIGRSPTRFGLFAQQDPWRTEGVPVETGLRRPGGESVEVELRSNPLPAEGGGGTVISVHDITARKAAEAELLASRDTLRQTVEQRTRELVEKNRALQQREARFRLLFEESLGLICTYDLDGRLTSVNPAAADLLGYDRTELLGESVLKFIPEQFRNEGADDLASLRAQSGHSGVVTFVARDGSWRALIFRSRLINDGVNPPFVLGHGQDVTALKKTEAKLRDSEHRYRDLFESSHDLIQAVDAEGRFLLVNGAWRRLLGYDEGDLEGLRALDVVHPDRRDAFQAVLDSLMAGEAAGLVETELLTREGVPMLVEGTLSCAFERGRPSSVRAIFRDITERRAVERLKDDFLSTVSHELRTPVTSIFGSLKLLAAGKAGAVPPAMGRYLDVASRNAQRLVWLIDDILDFQKIRSDLLEVRPVYVKVTDLVEQALEDNRGFATEHGIRLTLGESAPEAAVRVDRDWFLQLLANLISNAVKHSPQGEQVIVATSASARQVEVSVRDHGPGIPAEARETIFRPFSQLQQEKEARKSGTGLGLSIARAVAERFDGTLTFASDLGAGTTFRVTLPVASASFAGDGGEG
ncbi:MAG: PAS domain S-box protein [Acidobacteriota bacterium]